MSRPGRVLVVGAGAIGTSIALALRSTGTALLLEDIERDTLQSAVDRGAGRPYGGEPVDLVVVAVPPAVTAQLVLDQLRSQPGATVVDVASVKATVQTEVLRAAGESARRFIGSHPIAGTELVGPGAATSKLFGDRPWALVPCPVTDEPALRDAIWLIESCGGRPVRVTAADHDRVLARTSHLPQLTASALAATLGRLANEDLLLAGPGLADMTRIAASDPALWQQIALANSGHVATAVDELINDLRVLSTGLHEAAERPDQDTEAALADAVDRLMDAGAAGRRRLLRHLAG